MHGSGSVQVCVEKCWFNGVEVLILSEAHIYLLNNDGSSWGCYGTILLKRGAQRKKVTGNVFPSCLCRHFCTWYSEKSMFLWPKNPSGYPTTRRNPPMNRFTFHHPYGPMQNLHPKSPSKCRKSWHRGTELSINPKATMGTALDGLLPEDVAWMCYWRVRVTREF